MKSNVAKLITALWICLLLGGCIIIGGCIVISGGCKPDTICGGCPDADKVVMAEIDAVGKLSMEPDRFHYFSQIAARPDLPAHAQVYLVKSVFEKLHFEPDKHAVLLTLISNPAFSNPAKVEILKRLDRLHMQPDRSSILQAIQTRGNLNKPVSSPVPAVTN